MKRIGMAAVLAMLCLGSTALEAQERTDRDRSQRLRRAEPESTDRDRRGASSRRDRRAGEGRQRVFQPPAWRDGPDQERRFGDRWRRDDRQRDDRQRDDRRRGDRDDEPWFDPDWWYESPGDGRNGDGRDGDEPWFDPDWWYERPDDGRRPGRRPFPPRYRDRPGLPGPGPGDRWRGPRRGDDRAPRRSRAVLGVYFRDTPSGPRVASLVQDGPAAEAGLRRGDVLVAIDRRRVADIDDVRRVLRRYRPDERVRLRIERRDRIRRTTAVLQSRREVF